MHLFRIILESSLTRLLICMLMSAVFAIYPNSSLAYAMVVTALLSILLIGIRGEIGFLLAVIVSMQSLWLLLAVFVLELEVLPLAPSVVRYLVVVNEGALTVVFLGAQILFLFTNLLASNYQLKLTRNLSSPLLRFAALVVILVSTYYINRAPSIFEGVYEGNEANYWSGLPTIFVISIAAWVLLQSRYGISYFATLNFIVGWWLFHGNRSEILVIFIFGNFLFLSNLEGISRNRGFGFFLALSGLLVTSAVFSLVGGVREGNAASFDMLYSILNVVGGDRLNFQTFGSSIYGALATISWVEHNGLVWGGSIYGQLVNSIPSFIPTPWERYVDVSESVRGFEIIGGLGLLGEAYINFGMYGPALISAILVYFIGQMVVGRPISFFESWLLLSIVFNSQRFMLYGFVYLYNTLLFFIVLFLIKKALRFLMNSKPRLNEVF